MTKASQGKKLLNPYLGKPQHRNRAGGVAQVVECLSSKLETLSPNPSITKKKKGIKGIYHSN
jgi:hypothetical protein